MTEPVAIVSPEELARARVEPSVSIRAAAERLQANDVKILVVCDAEGRLTGTVTDGDLRRAVLVSRDLNGPVSDVMNVAPISARRDESLEAVADRMHEEGIRHIPLLGDDGRVVGLVEFGREREEVESQEAVVVLMAGGKGKRLWPLTESTPKPMLEVGGKPLLERQIRQLHAEGFRHFFISVNYLSEQIIEHFGDGSKFGVEIEYLREEEALGTAGAVSLLPKIETPVLIMNGDVLCRASFARILRGFTEAEVMATMCVRNYRYALPYGCVELSAGYIKAIVEKPEYSFLVNAGIYVLSPEAVQLAPKGVATDMPDLFQRILDVGGKADVYRINDAWIDIGRREDFELARDMVENWEMAANR